MFAELQGWLVVIGYPKRLGTELYAASHWFIFLILTILSLSHFI